MTTVKTIRQHTTTYTISQFGNRSFRISYVTDSNERVRHVEKVWSSQEEAEEYIATCNSMDAMLALGEGKYIPQQRYDAANTTQFKLKLNLTTDADILARLDEQESKQGYIKALIRADIATSKEEK